MPDKQPPSIESIEARLSHVEAIVSAGHAVAQRPGTAPSTIHISDDRSAAEAAAGVPPKAAEQPTARSTKTPK